MGETRNVQVEVTATDPSGAMGTGIVSVTITGTNDAPVMTAGALALTEDDFVAKVDLKTLTDDPDSNALTYEVTGMPDEGFASIRGDVLRFYVGQDFQDLAQGETRDVQVEITATDPDGATDANMVTVTVTGTSTNDAPVMAPVPLVVSEDDPVVKVDLNTLTGDPDGNDLTYEVTGTPTEGFASIRGDILRFYTIGDFDDLAQGEARVVQIEVTATAPNGATDAGIVSVTITGTNDAPVMSATTLSLTEDDPVVKVNLGSLTDDPDGDALTYQVTGTPAEGFASIRGEMLRFYPGQDFQDLGLGETRDVQIEITATDAYGATDTDIVTVTVTGAHDGPVDPFGFELMGEGWNYRLGDVVSAAGDLNNDGLADFVVGGGLSPGDRAAHVIFGRDTSEGDAFPALMAPTSDTDGLDLTSGDDQKFASAIAPAGDVNGERDRRPSDRGSQRDGQRRKPCRDRLCAVRGRRRRVRHLDGP